MSFCLSKEAAHACIESVELSENTRSSSGSKIYAGYSHPGGATEGTKPAKEVLQPGRLRAGINKPLTRTDTLQRKYAATGHNKEHNGKSPR